MSFLAKANKAKKEKVVFEIEVSPQAAPNIANLLATLHYLGSVGASRTVQLGWDGDGPDTLDVIKGPKESDNFKVDTGPEIVKVPV